MRDQSGNYLAVIKVVGAGGGGSNAVNRMVEAGLRGCEFIAVNTDAQALLMVEADQKIHIGAAATRGLGAGADPQKGYEAAMETRDELKEALKGADMVFVTAGEGGGTGTGAAPVVAEIARELGDALLGLFGPPPALEPERPGDDAHRERAELASDLRDDGSTAGTRAAAFAGRDEHHVRALERLLQLVATLLGGGEADAGIRAGAEAARRA